MVLTQPVSDGYHDLPLGASEVHAAAPAARLVRWPVIRYAGLLPWQVVFSHEDVGDPPVVPYHDVRTIALALGEDVPRTDPAGIRAVAHWSIAELHDRETRAGAVPVSRLVLDAGADASNTINHPGNPVLVPLARAIERRLGWPVTAADPGYGLPDSVRAPRDPRVLNALGLDVDDGLDVSGENWVVDGKPVPNSEVVEIHLAWYHQHPEVLAAVAARSAEQRRLLGRHGRMTVRYVVGGPTRHGVVRHALRLGASDPFLSQALVRVPSEVSGHEPPGLRDALPPGSTAFLHVTDRLFEDQPGGGGRHGPSPRRKKQPRALAARCPPGLRGAGVVREAAWRIRRVRLRSNATHRRERVRKGLARCLRGRPRERRRGRAEDHGGAPTARDRGFSPSRSGRRLGRDRRAGLSLSRQGGGGRRRRCCNDGRGRSRRVGGELRRCRGGP